MSDVELVIKIPEESYNALKSGMFINFDVRGGKTILQSLCRAIWNGIQLPKCHGDLIDRKELLNHQANIDHANYPSNYIRIAKPIIEADRKE